MFDAEALGKQIVESVRGYVARALSGVAERLTALEEQIKSIPAGPKGDQGEKGDPGLNGKDGAPGERGEKGETGEQGLKGEPGDPGAKGDTGEKGEKGDLGPQGEKGEPGPHGEKGDPGERGEPGAPGERGEKGDPGAPGERGEPGPRGEKGEKGDPGDRGEKGMDGRDGRDGKDGRDGAPGRDGAEIQPLPALDSDKSYPQGTWAKHEGGLWLSRAQTDGMTGWDCIIPPADRLEVDLGDDMRTLSVKVIRGANGKVEERKHVLPVVIDRGIYRQEESYSKGDGVTWGGSFWIAQKDAPEGTPGEGETGWRLAVKKGRDGRDGLRGEKGERGAEGRAGKDLTQMGLDGKKW